MTIPYTAADGSLWHIERDPPPVPTRLGWNWGWRWTSDDFDGAPDSGDTRCSAAATREGAEAAVEEWVADDE